VKRALNWRGATQPVDAAGAHAMADARADGDRASVADASWLRGFLLQLKRRHVYTVAVGYLAFGFLALQAAELIFPALAWMPSWVYPALVGVTLAGFPVALILGWIYDITRRGIERTAAPPASSDTEGSPSGRRGRNGQ
jgi:hypothetical protein